MHLTWHIVLKLLRHLWPWLALVTAIIATRYALLWHFEHRLDIDRPLFDRTASTDSFLYIIQHILLGLYIVAVLHEDSPLDQRAFWITRPISGLRLLAAKLIAIVIGALLLPLAGAILWWLLHDFRACDIAASIPHQLIIPTVVISIALACALFNRTWVGFFIAFFALILLAGLGSSSANKPSQQFDPTLSATRSSLVFFCATAGVAIGAYQLYRHRRVGLTRVLIAACTGICLLVHFFWPWPFPARYRFTGNPPPPFAPNTAGIRVSAQPPVMENPAPSAPAEWRAQLPLTLTELPIDHLATLRTASVTDGTHSSGNAFTARAAKSSRTNLPLPPRALQPPPETHTVVVDLKEKPSPQAPPSRGPSDPLLQVSFLLRSIESVAALTNTPGGSDHAGPYHLRMLAPSPPHRTSGTPDLSRTVTCLLVHPSQLTAPGTGIAEYCGAPNDTDEYGRHFDERATLFATFKNALITPDSRQSGTLTFTADGIFFVRRTLAFDLPPDDIASLKIHYVIYPALGTFERDITVQLPATATP